MRVPRWLPNAISTLRILLLPVWIGVAYGVGGPNPDPMHALGVLVVLGLTDVVDGFLARRFGLESKLGAALDASADKLSQVMVFGLACVLPPPGFTPVPWWFLGLLILRDLTMIVGLAWIWSLRGRLQVEHRWHGKLMSLGLFGLMVGIHWPANRWIASGFLVVAGLVLVSLVGYCLDGIQVLRSPQPKPEAARLRTELSSMTQRGLKAEASGVRPAPM